jgi:hypothetical protein
LSNRSVGSTVGGGNSYAFSRIPDNGMQMPVTNAVHVSQPSGAIERFATSRNGRLPAYSK